MKLTFILIVGYMLIHNQKIQGNPEEWGFISELQAVCPYTSFCDGVSNVSMPTSSFDDLRPCCMSCSCSSDCMDSNNCCNNSGHMWTAPQQKCMSSSTSEDDYRSKSYYMVHTCPSEEYGFTDCVQNKTDFEPVYSPSYNYIYVNQHCADCNNVNDGVKWRLALKTHQISRNGAIDETAKRVLQIDIEDHSASFMLYIPPKGFDFKSLECQPNIIYECNVTGNAYHWMPFWNYCPLFNSTFANGPFISFGNVFCYMCNVDVNVKVPLLCLNDEVKSTSHEDLILVLNYNARKVDRAKVTDATRAEQCGPHEAFVESFTSECRQLECPWGQFRHDDTCAFYSDEWIGNEFSVILKLTAIDQVKEVPTTVLTGMSTEVRYDYKAKWLKRNAMKRWRIKALYNPTVDQKFIQYMVVISTYQGTSVNPTLLRKTIEASLKETWTFSNENNTIRFKVGLNARQHYTGTGKSTFEQGGVHIDSDIGFLARPYVMGVFIDYLIPVSLINVNDFRYIINLSKLFLCRQVVLREDEYEMKLAGELKFKVTNKSLFNNEYRYSALGGYQICLDEFPASKFARHVSIWWPYLLFSAILCV